MPKGDSPNSRANLRPAKKGEVRNPTGINRKRPFADRYFQHSEELLSSSPEGEQFRKVLRLGPEATWADAAVRRLMREAMKGNIQAIKELADRIEGKSPERLEISGPERKEITIRIVHDRKKSPSTE